MKPDNPPAFPGPDADDVFNVVKSPKDDKLREIVDRCYWRVSAAIKNVKLPEELCGEAIARACEEYANTILQAYIRCQRPELQQLRQQKRILQQAESDAEHYKELNANLVQELRRSEADNERLDFVFDGGHCYRYGQVMRNRSDIDAAKAK